jgi:hypothetical protein
MMLQFVAALVLGLMCGSELNVAAFAHPTLNRQRVAVHIPVRLFLRGTARARDAFLDGRFNSAEFASAISFRASEHGFMAACRDRSRYPGGRGFLFSCRSSPDQ